MSTLLKSKTITISIECDSKTTYEFVSNPENRPQWAKTFCLSINRKGRNWMIETKQEPVELRLSGKNEFGVADHYVRPQGGNEIYVPLRVFANGAGSEVIFTIFQQPDRSDENFAQDISLVKQDLQTLKDTLTV